eukprot:GHVL01038569.1.p1 GENE.GHVL01038569.1~~GHVL01038569.1.p1  ORF type:complete len:367 (+),score=44.06 GHVL01038569.1:597-1697(+)
MTLQLAEEKHIRETTEKALEDLKQQYFQITSVMDTSTNLNKTVYEDLIQFVSHSILQKEAIVLLRTWRAKTETTQRIRHSFKLAKTLVEASMERQTLLQLFENVTDRRYSRIYKDNAKYLLLSNALKRFFKNIHIIIRKKTRLGHLETLGKSIEFSIDNKLRNLTFDWWKRKYDKKRLTEQRNKVSFAFRRWLYRSRTKLFFHENFQICLKNDLIRFLNKWKNRAKLSRIRQERIFILKNHMNFRIKCSVFIWWTLQLWRCANQNQNEHSLKYLDEQVNWKSKYESVLAALGLERERNRQLISDLGDLKDALNEVHSDRAVLSNRLSESKQLAEENRMLKNDLRIKHQSLSKIELSVRIKHKVINL